jgi:uncharacterized secreted protein with C-terminal beta-propeller domain
MKPLFSRGLLLTFAALLACSSGHSGGDSGPGTQAPFSAKLVKAVDAPDMEKRLKAELTRWYERQNARYLYYGGLSYADGQGGITTPGSEPQTSNPDASGGATDTSHSETNVQEAGVDEGDLVKTDGTYLYLARGSHFFVLLANPANQSSIVSDIDLAEDIIELHLSNSRVTIITTPFTTGPLVGTAVMSGRPSTKAYCYDVTTPSSLVQTARFEFPGYLQGSRRINDTIYLVTNFTIDLPSPVTPWDYLPSGSYDQNVFNAASNQALAENLSRINALTLNELLPTYTITPYNGGLPGTAFTAPVVAYNDIYIPEYGNGIDLSLVIILDTSGQVPAVAASTAVLSSWCQLYMSVDNLYLASSNNWLWIEPVTGLDLPQANPEPRTAVHKFAVSGNTGQPLYQGSGVVDGWVNNRFSMSDYQGYLRIGTTRGGWWGEGISNQLAVLVGQDGQLLETGKLTGLAPGENIYAMRFDRDRGYMVTFRQTDPLFTLDLSDPANPRVAGELKVTGFTTYIHLLGTSTPRLLTIGRSADSTGLVTGNKLQLFDVSDLEAPQLLGDYELGTGWSDALYDPHAFLYYEPLGILTIPYYAYGTTLNTYSSGLNVFDIGAASISLRGKIPAKTITTGYGNYLDTVDRSVIIGSTIYSAAHRSVTAVDSAQLDVIIKVVDLPESYAYSPAGTGGNPGTVMAPK